MSNALYPSLKGQVVLITGGASGIGAAMVEAFMRQGCQVAFVDIDRQAADQLCAHVEQKGLGLPLFVYADLSDMDAVGQAVHSVAQQLGGLHVLVNNAANDQRHSTAEVTPTLWQAMMQINLQQQFFAAQAAVVHMKVAGGVVVNMSSNCYLLSQMPSYPLYAIAKSGIVGLTRALACEFGHQGVRVNAVMPGWTMTSRQIEQWLTPEAKQQLLAEQCIQMCIQPEDIASTVLFLASADSRMITKQCLIVDGGRV